MSTPATVPATSNRDIFARAQALASSIDTPCVLNTNAMLASADAKAVITILSGEAAVVEMPVPLGATYLKMCLVYVGSAPTVACSVRVFGRVPILKGYSTGLLPEGVHASYGAWTLGKGAGEGVWVPRGNDASGNLVATLSNTVAMIVSTGNYCEPSIVHVGGCDRVIVPVVTAAVTPTRAIVFGWFEQ